MICARIQAHPTRSDLIPALVAAIGLPTEVFLHESDPPNPWEGYKRCLTDIPDCSHLLIVQDDAIPCPNFAPAVEQIAHSNPDVPVCLFLGGFPQGTGGRFRRAQIKDQRYIDLLRSPVVPVIAILWPRQKAQEFLDWASGPAKLPGHPNPRADDGVAAAWANATRQHIRVCVPCLVEHPDMVSSVKGGIPARWGKDPRRKALAVAEDGLRYEW